MKIYHIDKPLQNDKTINPQIIDGKVYHWCVNAEGLKLGETLTQWFERKRELIKNNPVYKDVEGIFLYDLQPVVPVTGIGNAITFSSVGAMIVRYAYIKK